MSSSTRRPTIGDVATAAGVSRTTVSHALNDLGKVDPNTRDRVKRVASELGYRPNLRAQRLRTGQARTIALASSMPLAVAGGPSRLGFYMEVAAAAAEYALTQDYSLVLVPPSRSASDVGSVDVDGAILVEPEQDDPVAAQLHDRGLPFVTIGRQIGAPSGIPYVDLHGGAVAELLLAHLREQGAHHPALVTGSGTRHSYVDSRYRVTDGGHAEVLTTADESGGEQAGYEACSQLLDRHPDTDAVCVLVDAFAVGAMRALADRGLRVPSDVMVATRYNGIRAQTCDPPLTAVDLHLDVAAAEAVELLLARLRGEDDAAAAETPPPRLVPRASSLRLTSPA